MYNAMLDSALWDRLEFRDDDIVIASWPKSGTTWTQQIVSQLVFRGDPELLGLSISPWIENRFMRQLRMADEQQHRRILKTHLPAGSVPIVRRAKYIYVARDPLDAYRSWHRHRSLMSDAAYELMNRTPGRERPKVGRPDPDFCAAFGEWLEKDDALAGPIWSNVQSWWDMREKSNILLIHYSELTADIVAAISRVANFLEIEVDATLLEASRRHSSLEHMKALASREANLAWTFVDQGESFVHRGSGGHWRSELSDRAVEKLHEVAGQQLSIDCKEWLFLPLPQVDEAYRRLHQ